MSPDGNRFVGSIKPPKLDNIPQELRQGGWVVWIAEPKPNQPEKFNKAPRSPFTGKLVSVNDYEQHGTFDDAQLAYKEGACSGIGKVLRAGEGIVGFDIDNFKELFAERRDLRRWLELAIDKGAYLEKSPSGKGLRLFVVGRLPGGGRKSGGLEVYDQKRFITLTGHIWKNGGLGPSSVLIDGQDLVDSFLDLLPADPIKNFAGSGYTSNAFGQKSIEDLDHELRAKISDLIGDSDPLGTQRIRDLFNGDTSTYGNDQSRADLALISHLRGRGLTQEEADSVFRCSSLYRSKWDEKRGDSTYGERTITKGYMSDEMGVNSIRDSSLDLLSYADQYTPRYYELGLPPREFFGPEISLGARLFPCEGLTTISALGASGKTTFVVNIGAHIAAGRCWNEAIVRKRKVMIFSVEETQEELNRKFSATVEDWDEGERSEAIKNLRLVSLVGKDARFTKTVGRQVDGSGLADQVNSLCCEFGLDRGVVFLDHYQGLVSGDLNLSDTATGFCREANKIATALNSAVVILSHTSKQNMNTSSKEIGQGHSSGSLAFENAMRQTIVMVTMTKEEAKGYGLDEEKPNHVWLGLPKNSYGNAEAGLWLKKNLIEKFHTIRLEPVTLEKPIKQPPQSTQERLEKAIISYINTHPFTTKNSIEKAAGMNSVFKASAKAVRASIDQSLSVGKIFLHLVTSEERHTHTLTKQIKEVLRVPG
jgi:RecA-family ATPase